MCTKKRNLQRAVGRALKDCPQDLLPKPFTSIEEVQSIDIIGCCDEKGQTVKDDCLEHCKKGNFTASVKMEAPCESGKIIPPKTVSGTFEVTDYDSKTYSFTAKIELVYLSS